MQAHSPPLHSGGLGPKAWFGFVDCARRPVQIATGQRVRLYRQQVTGCDRLVATLRVQYCANVDVLKKL